VRRKLGLVAVGLLLAVPSSLPACVCTETGGIGDELRASTAVFLGRIIALNIDTVVVEGTSVERMRATFRVDRQWKGRRRPTTDIWTCGDQVAACTCGVDFRLGERYVVFASGKPLSTGSCDRTKAAGAAETLIAELDKLSPTAKGRITTR
jgi:hypothetical protein